MTTEGQTHWRMFCAVELPDALRSRVGEHARLLREAFPRVRASWERPEKIHITLKFLGDVEVSRVEELSRAAGRAAAHAEPFELTIARPGAFPPHGPPRVLWRGIEDASGKLSNLHRSLEDDCPAVGFQRDSHPFKPHLT